MSGVPENLRIIVIAGARRTGTTLVNQILCCDPGAHAQVGEARLLTQFFQVYTWGNANYDNVVKWYFEDRQDYKAFFRNIIDSFVDRAKRQLLPVDKLVLKTPSFSGVVEEALELLPGSTWVVCVRHPLDQVASDFEVGLRQIERGMGAGNRASRRDFASYARTYLRHCERLMAAAAREPERFTFLRYEDLVLDTLATIRRLEEALQLDLSAYDSTAPWIKFRNQQELRRMPAHVPQYGGPIDASRVGRHESVLTPRERAQVVAICKPVLERFYPESR